MPCKAQNEEQLASLIENNKAIFDIKQDQSASDTVSYLRYTQDNFAKKDGRYTVGATNTKLKTTITTRVGEWYEKRNPVPMSPEKRAIVNQQAEIGNVGHETIELMVKDLINELSPLTVTQALARLNNVLYEDKKSGYAEGLKKIREKYGYQVSEAAYDNLFKGTVQLLRQIYTRQNRINKDSSTEGNVTIMSEQIIIDATDNVGGTADLIAVLSNNDVMLFDFKTKIPNKESRNPDGTIKTDMINKVFNASSKERYKLQLSAISKILKRRYGARNVIASRIAPVTIGMEGFEQGVGYKRNIVRARFGAAQDPALLQLPVLPEKTGFEDLDEFLTNVERRIRNLKAKAKEDRTRRKEYQDKVNELEAGKATILTRHNFDAMLLYAKKLDDSLTTERLERMDVKELRETLDELNMLAMLSASTYEFRQYMRRSGQKLEEIKSFEEKVGSTIAGLNDRIVELEHILYNDKVVALIEESTNRKITDAEGRVIPFADEGFLGKYFNQLSQFDNPVFQALRARLDSVQFDTRQSVQAVIQEVQDIEDALYNWMAQTGKTKEWLVKTLIDPKTDNFYGKRSEAFNQKLREIRVQKDVAGIIQNYEASKGFNDFVAKTKDKISDANARKEFVGLHDLSLDKAGKPKNPDAWINALYKGYLRIKPEVEQANLSDQYRNIQSIPEVAAYYNMFVKYNKQFRDMLGLEYFNLPDNFLANVRKDTVDRLVDDGIVNGSKSALNNFIEQFNVREDDMYYGEMEDGQLMRRIPRFFINPFKDASGNLAIGEKSYEFGRSLVLFAKMAYNYKYLVEEEANILALRDFVAERGQEFITRQGKKMEDFVGNKLTSKLGNTDMKQIFDSFVDMYLYGIHIQPTLGDKSGTWEKRLLLAKQYFTTKALGFNFIAASGSYLAAKTNVWIEGNKGLIYTKQDYLDSLKSSYSERDKFLALYAFFDPMSIRYENFSVTNEKKLGGKYVGDPKERSFIKKYVNSRTLLRPFSYGDEHIDEVIASAMARNYYVDELGNFKRIKNDAERQLAKGRTIWDLFSYNGEEAKLSLPEEQLKNVIIAFRKAVQAGQSRIKGTIPEEDKAYWQSQIVGQLVMHFKSWMPGIMRERFGDLKYNNALQTVELGKYRAVGFEISNVDQLATREYMKQVLLPKIADFAQHLLLLGKYGRLNDVNRKKEAFEKWLDQNPHFKDRITFEEFLDVQQKQIRSLMVELRIILSFAAIMMMLGADWDDDGEKNYQELWLARKIVAIMSKTNQELTFAYNPVEFSKMIANPLPMLRLVSDMQKTIGNTFDEALDIPFGEDRAIGGSKRDKTPIGYYTHQWIPGASGISKLLDVFNQDSGQAYR